MTDPLSSPRKLADVVFARVLSALALGTIAFGIAWGFAFGPLVLGGMCALLGVFVAFPLVLVLTGKADS